MQSWSQLVSRLVIRRKKKQSSVPDTLQAGGLVATGLSANHNQHQNQVVHEHHQKEEKKNVIKKDPEQPQQSSSTPPSTLLGQDVKVDVGTLEFPASRDLALTLGDEWNEDRGMVLPSLDHFLPPPIPAADASSVLRKKSTRNRLSLYRPKSTLHLLRGSKSIPQIVS